jgi:hypothetical protein
MRNLYQAETVGEDIYVLLGVAGCDLRSKRQH